MTSIKKSLPVFEITSAFYYLYCAMVMFIYPQLVGSDKSDFYVALANILSPNTWAYIAFAIGMILCYGLYSNKGSVRTLGLLLSGIVYMVFALSFARSFPNFSTGLYVILTAASISAIATIKRTEL